MGLGLGSLGVRDRVRFGGGVFGFGLRFGVGDRVVLGLGLVFDWGYSLVGDGSGLGLGFGVWCW